jgi:nucleoid-associated protein YgaU
VGIDPNGGTDPYAPAIIWGPWIAPHDRWEQATVNATANGDTATLFIATTQTWPADFNNRWFDNASLTVGGPGGRSPAGTGSTVSGNGTTPAPRPTASIAVRQPPQPDGSIVHVVQAGDTLSGISIAYGVPVATILELNNLTPADTRRIRVGQRLVIAPS